MDPTADRDLAAELLALELALARRDLAGLPGGAEAVLDAAFVEFGQSGRRWERAETLALMAAGEVPADLTIEDFVVDRLADGVALVTYRLSGTTRQGERRASRRSSVWVLRAGGWRLRFHQGTTTAP